MEIMMLTNLLTDLTPQIHAVIVDLLMTALLALLVWLGRRLPAWMHIQIEARHRDALHSALSTGVKLALDRITGAAAANGSLARADQAVTSVIGYVQDSVPDALRALAPSPEHLERMARAKLQEALAAAQAASR